MQFNANVSVKIFPALRFRSRADDRAASSSIKKTGSARLFFWRRKAFTRGRAGGETHRLRARRTGSAALDSYCYSVIILYLGQRGAGVTNS